MFSNASSLWGGNGTKKTISKEPNKLIDNNIKEENFFWMVSEQRRSELLKAARQKRIAWIEGFQLSNQICDSYLDKTENKEEKESLNVLFPCVNEIDLFLKKLYISEEIEQENQKVISIKNVLSPSQIKKTFFIELMKKKENILKNEENNNMNNEIDESSLNYKEINKTFILDAYEEFLNILKHISSIEIIHLFRNFVDNFNINNDNENIIEKKDIKIITNDKKNSKKYILDKNNKNINNTIIENQLEEEDKGKENKRNDVSDLLFFKNPNTNGIKVHNFINELIPKVIDQGELISQEITGNFNIKYLKNMEVCHEVLEAFLMEKLHEKIFLNNKLNDKIDEYLKEKINSLYFIEFHHLDIEKLNDTLDDEWNKTINKLKLLNTYLSPRQKLNNCILQVCEDISILLSNKKINENNNKENVTNNHILFPSADEFLPALIYVIIKANPSKLYSNIKYIKEYRNPNQLVSKDGYFFTHFISGVSFLENLDDNTSLSISQEEFDEKISLYNDKILNKEQSKHENNADNHSEVNSKKKPMDEKNIIIDDREENLLNILEFREKRIQLEKMIKTTNNVFQDVEKNNDFVDTYKMINENHFKYIDYSIDMIRIADIGPLLDEYKFLYNFYKVNREKK